LRLHLTSKLFFIIGLFAVLNASANVYSDSKRISIQVKDVEIRELFREIENNSEYTFFFNEQFAELDKKVSMDITDQNISMILDKLLDNTLMDYEILDNDFVVIVPKSSKQPGTVITGTVNDAYGDPIPGVNIVEKGTTNGAITDLTGNYSITVTTTDAVLIFSSVGYNEEEIDVGTQTKIDLILIESIEVLDEVVVIGYGSMQRTNVTGSIASIKGEEITKAPVPNLVEALRGQIPGVRITRNSGLPGSDVDFTIRGKRSIGAAEDEDNPELNVNANEPLIVIDGVPYTGGSISDINPDDIENIDVLKDAAATSIYGSSAANGVVLITTKSGVPGKTSIRVNASTGITDLVQRPEMFDGPGYLQLKIDAVHGSREVEQVMPEEVLDPIELENYYAGEDMDWHDAILKKGRINQFGVSITGGTNKFKYYVNGDLYRETGIVQHSTYNRYSFRVNSEYAPYNFVKIGARALFATTQADETGTTLDASDDPDFGDFIGNSTWGRTEDSLGNLTPTANSDQFQHNPLYRYAHSEAQRNKYRTSITPYIEFRIIEGLTYKINGFVEFRNERFTRYLDGEYDAQRLGENTYKVDFGQGYSYLLDNIVNFERTFAQKHMVNVTGVYGFQGNRFENMIMQAVDLNTNYLGIYDIENVNPALLDPELNPKKSGKAYFVARLGYAYDNRYSLTLSRRWDYTSQFGPDRKKGVFSSAAAAWNVHNEAFLQNFAQLTFLKYRISWGEVGNDRIPEFSYVPSASPSTYTWSGNVVNGWTTGESGNNILQWETSKQFNTGIDFGFFRSRISGMVDYYLSKNIDLLYEEQVPIIFGDADGLIMANVAETKSWGIDASLTGKIFNGDFKWIVTVNWAKDKNEIVNLGGAKVDEEGNPIDDPANGWFIGEDIDVIYDYDFIGVYQLGEEATALAMHPDKAYYTAGDPKIRDISGPDGVPDGIIDEYDKTFLGSSVTPKWYGGLTSTFSYKGIELSILLETVQGIKRVNYFINALTGRDNTVKINYWTPDNPTNDFPQPNARSVYDYRDAVRVQDASFLAIRNVSLSYDLPSSLFTNIPIQGVRVYVRGNNLKYFTKYTLSYSPESDWQEYPITKNWTFGLNVTF